MSLVQDYTLNYLHRELFIDLLPVVISISILEAKVEQARDINQENMVLCMVTYLLFVCPSCRRQDPLSQIRVLVHNVGYAMHQL